MKLSLAFVRFLASTTTPRLLGAARHFDSNVVITATGTRATIRIGTASRYSELSAPSSLPAGRYELDHAAVAVWKGLGALTLAEGQNGTILARPDAGGSWAARAAGGREDGPVLAWRTAQRFHAPTLAAALASAGKALRGADDRRAGVAIEGDCLLATECHRVISVPSGLLDSDGREVRLSCLDVEAWRLSCSALAKSSARTYVERTEDGEHVALTWAGQDGSTARLVRPHTDSVISASAMRRSLSTTTPDGGKVVRVDGWALYSLAPVMGKHVFIYDNGAVVATDDRGGYGVSGLVPERAPVGVFAADMIKSILPQCAKSKVPATIDLRLVGTMLAIAGTDAFVMGVNATEPPAIDSDFCEPSEAFPMAAE